MKKDRNPKNVEQQLKDFDKQISNLSSNITSTEAQLITYKEKKTQLEAERKDFLKTYYCKKKGIFLSGKVKYTKEYFMAMHSTNVLDSYHSQRPITVMNINSEGDNGEVLTLSNNGHVNIHWLEKA